MRHRDFEVVIECDGQPLEEYTISVDGSAIECFVASEPGKVFEIVCSNLSLQHRTVQPMVDGRRFPRCMGVKGGASRRKPYVEDGVDGAKPLLFSAISVTDKEEAAGDLGFGGQLGEIQIRVVRSEPKEQIEWVPSTIQETRNFGTIHETAKKAGMHCVSFGATIPVPRTVVRVTDYLDTFSLPYITFTFRYRPRAILQAQGIIEHGPIPDRPPVGSPRASAEPNSPRETLSPSTRRESPEAELRRDELPSSTRPKKRARHGSASSTNSGSPTGDASAIPDAEGDTKLAVKDEDDVEDVDALEAQLAAIRRRINRAKALKTARSGSRVAKRERSPIQVGQFHGGVIDLTDD